MRRLRTIVIGAVLATVASTAALGAPACPEHYLDGVPPSGPGGTVELCNTAYAVSWNSGTRDPAYVVEHLTAPGLQYAKDVPRGNGFRADRRLQPGDRVAPADYPEGSGFDRGHMAPDHDMPNAAAVHESFLLTNVVPQVSENNRGPWAQIEETARDLVVSAYGGEGWVVTGPAFSATPQLLGGRVAVPSQLWKAVYVPGGTQAGDGGAVGAWVVDNAVEPHTRFVSLDELRATFGVDPFPTLSPEQHATAVLSAGAAKRTHVAVH